MRAAHGRSSRGAAAVHGGERPTLVAVQGGGRLGFAWSRGGGTGKAALTQVFQRLHGGAMLTLDPAAEAQERAQRLEGRRLGGLGLGRVGELPGGEQVGQHHHLEPVGALLAPHAANGGLRGLVLVQVARPPGRPATAPRAPELGGVLVGQEEECPPAQAVAHAVEGGAGLADFGGGAGGVGTVLA